MLLLQFKFLFFKYDTKKLFNKLQFDINKAFDNNLKENKRK